MSRHSESLWRLERWRQKRETPVAEAGTEDINDYVSENGAIDMAARQRIELVRHQAAALSSDRCGHRSCSPSSTRARAARAQPSIVAGRRAAMFTVAGRWQ